MLVLEALVEVLVEVVEETMIKIIKFNVTLDFDS